MFPSQAWAREWSEGFATPLEELAAAGPAIAPAEGSATLAKIRAVMLGAGLAAVCPA